MDFSDLRAFYDSGATRSFFARKAALEGLLSGVIRHEEALLRAMEEDLGKSRFEGYMTEVGLVRDEIRFQLKHLKRWMHPHRVPTPLTQFHAVSREVPEPYGLALVMAPWNYPVPALAWSRWSERLPRATAPCIKPSATMRPHTAQALQSLIEEALLPPEHGRASCRAAGQENQALLGSAVSVYLLHRRAPPSAGSSMEKAARHLNARVCLELGGKSPVHRAGQHRRRPPGRQAHRVRQAASNCRADLRGARLRARADRARRRPVLPRGPEAGISAQL